MHCFLSRYLVPGKQNLSTSILISTRRLKSVAKYSILAISPPFRETFSASAHKTLSGFTNGITFRSIFTAPQQKTDFQNVDRNCHTVKRITAFRLLQETSVVIFVSVFLY
jgi:hypothetical protein